MKVKIALAVFMTIALQALGQNDSILKYTYDKENIVASIIDGTWKSLEEETQITFKKDTTVLRLLSPKYYAFKEKTIYHAGYMTEKKKANLPFILIEHHGNPCIVIFEKKDNNIHLVNGFYLFIARGVYRNEDKLILGGDHGTDYAKEFIRVK